MGSPVSSRPPLSISSPRRRILAAATRAFAERGYRATTIEQLLDAAGLERGTFDACFAGKEDCFIAVLDAIIAKARRRVVAAALGPQLWPDRVAAGYSAVLEQIEADRLTARLVLIGVHSGPRTVLDLYLARIEEVGLFMREGRDLLAPGTVIPPMIDTALPGGIAFMLRSQLIEGKPVIDLYAEGLRFLLLPYLGEPQTKHFIATANRAAAG